MTPEEAAEGAFLGALIGDAAGSTLEFKDTIGDEMLRRALAMKGGGLFKTAPGQITDDGELSLSLAWGLVEGRGKLDLEAIAASYAAWVASKPFDIGQTTRSALSVSVPRGESLAKAMTAAAKLHCTASQSNGAMMRVVPLAIWGHKLPQDDLITACRLEVALTHPHRVVQDAQICYCMAVAHLISHPGDRRGAWEKVHAWASKSAEKDVKDWLALAHERTSIPFAPMTGWVKIAFVHAFRHLLIGSDYYVAISETLKGGGDTDTNSCIVGGLVGAATGVGGIPKDLRSKKPRCLVFVAPQCSVWMGCRDGSLLIFDAQTGALLEQARAHAKAVTALLCIDDTAVLSGSEDGYLSVWRMENEVLLGSARRPRPKSGPEMEGWLRTPDGLTLFALTNAPPSFGKLLFWHHTDMSITHSIDLAETTVIETQPGEAFSLITRVEESQTTELTLTALNEDDKNSWLNALRTVQDILSSSDRVRLLRSFNNNAPITCLLRVDPTTCWVGSQEPILRMYRGLSEMTGHPVLRTINLERSSPLDVITCMVGHRGCVWVAVASVIVKFAESQQPVLDLRGHRSAINALLVADTACLWSASNDGSIRRWDLETGACLGVVAEGLKTFSMLQVGGQIWSGGFDVAIQLWDARSGARLNTLSGHTEAVVSLIRVRDDAVWSASWDRSICIWTTI